MKTIVIMWYQVLLLIQAKEFTYWEGILHLMRKKIPQKLIAAEILCRKFAGVQGREQRKAHVLIFSFLAGNLFMKN